MSNSIIINDASLPFSSSVDCKSELEDFFKIIQSADSAGVRFNQADDRHGNWNTLNYAEGFIFGEWINHIDKDISLIVKNVISKVHCPIIELEEDKREALSGMLFMLSSDRNLEVTSLGVASNIDSHAISFLSHNNWASNPISIVRQWEENEEWKEQLIDVPNISSLEHLEAYIAELENEKPQNKNYLRDLVLQDNKDFPNLIFCNSALKDFKSPSVTVDDFHKIIKALEKLNKAILISNDIEALKLNSELTISGESSATLENGKYARQREFKHPTLGKKLFEKHVKNFPDAKRMHILADFNNNKVSIGYFGSHLPTVRHPK
ncbi:conserved hypothetical protein [Bathymodiolus platifrons methanotrophic gill symbiont]|uniref:hypothetical protein n=1 Tax=Bathymodiolus platifrons methanotrophic gill symbiont TaxID=113268 RepID=UPI000B41A55C|nr:hypothetical protein [Bathymodiolus platifrons methanotrophic gill symbiont]GAW87531.1 conserved hypothetical protein [Bathymodiolus platifrons methanotrophic gill symbiont]GFO75736.1 hypothetical protein BPLS_P3112 [Bathymodiolus platifrons methanotrophic gill symbiont]